MEIYDINGQIIDPLAGKTLYVAGDSIAYGKGSAGGYGKCIADRYGMQLINEAVDGATLATLVPDNVNGGYRTSIGMTVKSSTELEKADYILLEGGVNDAWNNAKLGALNGSFDPAFYSGDTIGTLEAMLDDLSKKHSDKRVAYVFPHGGLFASSENWYKTYKPAILAALQSRAFYIGCLGSSRTHASRLDRLRASGVDEDSIARLHGPVGLKIGAQTAAEIAISIMAEITATLRKAGTIRPK